MSLDASQILSVRFEKSFLSSTHTVVARPEERVSAEETLRGNIELSLEAGPLTLEMFKTK